mgnify:FL=1
MTGTEDNKNRITYSNCALLIPARRRHGKEEKTQVNKIRRNWAAGSRMAARRATTPARPVLIVKMAEAHGSSNDFLNWT